MAKIPARKQVSKKYTWNADWNKPDGELYYRIGSGSWFPVNRRTVITSDVSRGGGELRASAQPRRRRDGAQVRALGCLRAPQQGREAMHQGEPGQRRQREAEHGQQRLQMRAGQEQQPADQLHGHRPSQHAHVRRRHVQPLRPGGEEEAGEEERHEAEAEQQAVHEAGRHAPGPCDPERTRQHPGQPGLPRQGLLQPAAAVAPEQEGCQQAPLGRTPAIPLGGADWQREHGLNPDGMVGPLTVAEVQARFAAGEIDSESYIWREGFTDWLPLAQVPEFANLIASGSTTTKRVTPSAGSSSSSPPCARAISAAM